MCNLLSFHFLNKCSLKTYTDIQLLHKGKKKKSWEFLLNCRHHDRVLTIAHACTQTPKKESSFPNVLFRLASLKGSWNVLRKFSTTCVSWILAILSIINIDLFHHTSSFNGYKTTISVSKLSHHPKSANENSPSSTKHDDDYACSAMVDRGLPHHTASIAAPPAPMRS